MSVVKKMTLRLKLIKPVLKDSNLGPAGHRVYLSVLNVLHLIYIHIFETLQRTERFRVHLPHLILPRSLRRNGRKSWAPNQYLFSPSFFFQSSRNRGAWPPDRKQQSSNSTESPSLLFKPAVSPSLSRVPVWMVTLAQWSSASTVRLDRLGWF